MCWHLILICHQIVTRHNPKVAERKLLSVICEELVNVSRCVSPPSGYKYLHPRVNIFAPDLEPLDLQADKAADSQLAQRKKKKKRKTRKKNWNEMFARGEGNTVQYPIYAHGTEAPLSAAAYIKRTSQTEFRISGTHSNTQTGSTSEAHTLHILKRMWWAFFLIIIITLFLKQLDVCVHVCVCPRELVIMGCYWVSPRPQASLILHTLTVSCN